MRMKQNITNKTVKSAVPQYKPGRVFYDHDEFGNITIYEYQKVEDYYQFVVIGNFNLKGIALFFKKSEPGRQEEVLNGTQS